MCVGVVVVVFISRHCLRNIINNSMGDMNCTYTTIMCFIYYFALRSFLSVLSTTLAITESVYKENGISYNPFNGFTKRRTLGLQYLKYLRCFKNINVPID